MGERRVLLASHGHLASGLKSSLQILTGDASAVTAIDAYVDETDFVPTIEEFLAASGEGDETIVFTDLLGGSVFQKVSVLLASHPGVIHVTGMNLAVVIGCLLSDEPLTPEVVDGVVAMASDALERVEIPGADPANEGDAADDDFFA